MASCRAYIAGVNAIATTNLMTYSRPIFDPMKP